MFNKPGKTKQIVVKTYPYENSSRSILNLLKSGQYYNSNGKADDAPFSSYIAVSTKEVEEYVKADGTPDYKARERYIHKKRRIFLDQFIALKLLGFAQQKNKTSSAEYGLTSYGAKMVQGLSIMEEAEKLGLSYDDVLSKIKSS
jgi:hypothetical protein